MPEVLGVVVLIVGVGILIGIALVHLSAWLTAILDSRPVVRGWSLGKFEKPAPTPEAPVRGWRPESPVVDVCNQTFVTNQGRHVPKSALFRGELCGCEDCWRARRELE